MMSPVQDLVHAIKYIRLMERTLAQATESEVDCRYAFEKLRIENELLNQELVQLRARFGS
jgi:hypothetical protein